MFFFFKQKTAYEIVNNYYDSEPPAGSEHHQVQSDNSAQGAGEPIQNADLGQDQDLAGPDDRTDLVDTDTQDSGSDLGYRYQLNRFDRRDRLSLDLDPGPHSGSVRLLPEQSCLIELDDARSPQVAHCHSSC